LEKPVEMKYTNELISYIKPADENDAEEEIQRNTAEGRGTINETDLEIPIWFRFIFIAKVMLLTFPLWNAGNAAVTRRKGQIDVVYLPPKGQVVDLESFVRRVIGYTARTSAIFSSGPGFIRITIWAGVKMYSEVDGYCHKWTGLKLSVTEDLMQKYGMNCLANLAKTDPGRFLELAYARWVDEDSFPNWPLADIPG
jgi:hypothetical protein